MVIKHHTSVENLINNIIISHDVGKCKHFVIRSHFVCQFFLALILYIQVSFEQRFIC